MFSCVVAGRPVITDLQTISPTQFAFNIPTQPHFSHLVVFLLPGNTLPPDTAAAVYIQLPPSTEFKLLGAIANDKQSAVFKVNASSTSSSVGTAVGAGDDDMVDAATALPAAAIPPLGGPNIVLGISVEPIGNIQAQLANLTNRPSTTQTENSATALVKHQPQQTPIATRILAQRIIKNAFNFLSGFAGGTAGSEVVPLKSFQDWWTKFEKRIELDPSFLERDD